MSHFQKLFLVLLMGTSVLFCQQSSADVIDVDISGVAGDYKDDFAEAEAFWESRIQNYSEKIPRALLIQLTSLKITAITADIDGPGGVLGSAGPRSVLSIETGTDFERRTVVLALTSMMQFDNADLVDLEADGILQKVIRHEMGHALGIGSLWMENNLIQPLGGVGQFEYVGPFGVSQYRIDIEDPSVTFVPIEQRGGGGTALSHWNDAAPFFNQVFTARFTKELMTGFACDIDPVSGATLCPPSFTANCTWGSAADLGFEVAGINDNTVDPPRGEGTGRWPKEVGGGQFDPFGGNGITPGAGLEFSLVNINVVTRRSTEDGNGLISSNSGGTKADDPYQLRNQGWVK